MDVKTLCLGILQFGDATGYEIRKMAQEGRFSHFIEASYGSIYPALVRLESNGLVTSRKETHEGRPDRKVYSINEAGMESFVSALNNDPRDDIVKSEFLFVMMCAELVSPNHLNRLIDNRMAHLDENIAHLEEVLQSCDHKSSQFGIGYGLAMYKALRGYLADHRHELEPIAGLAISQPADAAE